MIRKHLLRAISGDRQDKRTLGSLHATSPGASNMLEPREKYKSRGVWNCHVQGGGGGSYIGQVDCNAQRCGFRHPEKIQAERSRYLQIACGKTKTNNSYKAAENSQPAPYTICATSGNPKPSTQNLKPKTHKP